MKELVYLDTTFLHSFIAQQHSGLPTNHSTEFQESETTADTKGKSGQLQNELGTEFSTGEFKIPGLFETPSGKAKYRINHTRTTNNAITLTQFEAGKEIISKQLHDDALMQFEEFLEENSLIRNIDEEYVWRNGDYICLRKSFSVYDITHIKNIFNPNGILTAMEFAFESEKTKKRAQLQAAGTSEQEIKSVLRGFEQQQKSQFDEMKKMMGKFREIIDYFQSILPSSAFIKAGDVICPLKPENLRENAQLLNFKYGQDQELPITILGKYTRTFDQYVNLSGAFGPLGDVIGEFDNVFEILGIIKKGDKIVSPVAIYFE
ncbi:DUF6414 family protein [Paenibacillus sp. IHBB 3054]|uniref:DUF6414 family protein n=1 Tax=Paenibacillus sp. IHBB 3054 TaxID=3425689 RepID=UPI003F66A751